MQRQSAGTGFTLIEVMVALMILAVVAVTATRASSGYLRTVDGMKTRTLAHFVAQNMATDLIINEKWLTASKQEMVAEQGHQWQVTYTPSTVDNLPNLAKEQQQALQLVTINVAKVLDDPTKTGTGSEVRVLLSKASG